MKRAVFLDRDGVLNRLVVEDGVPRAPARLDALELLPDVPEALALLERRGLALVVVTNQPDVARGRISRGVLDEIHGRLRATLPLHDVLACDHDDGDRCVCRKPLPGLLLRAAKAHDLDLARSFLVGDRWKDIAAGRAAGCTTLLLEGPHSERALCPPDYDVRGLLGAAERILALV